MSRAWFMCLAVGIASTAHAQDALTYDDAVARAGESGPTIDAGGASVYRIADNKIAAMSAWDINLLPAELQAIREADLGLDSTGFEVGEIDFIMDQDAEDRKSVV